MTLSFAEMNLRTSAIVRNLESVDEILTYEHSNESFLAILSVVLFIMLYKVILTFESVDENLQLDPSNESY